MNVSHLEVYLRVDGQIAGLTRSVTGDMQRQSGAACQTIINPARKILSASDVIEDLQSPSTRPIVAIG